MNHPTSSHHFNIRPIRQLLLAAFSDEEFTIFCYDYFPAAYREFTIGMTFSAKVQLLLDDCAEMNSFDTLLGWVQKSNPNQYAEFAPALQSLTSTLRNIPTKTLKAIPIEKLGAAVSRPKWPIGWLMLISALTLGWAGYIFYAGLVIPRQIEPLRISFEPIIQLISQPAPEPIPLPTPTSTEELPRKPTLQATVKPTTEPALEPTLSLFIEPEFEPTNELTTPLMLETTIEPSLELVRELPVETTAAFLSEQETESILSWQTSRMKQPLSQRLNPYSSQHQSQTKNQPSNRHQSRPKN